jgi:hypothetical protein
MPAKGKCKDCEPGSKRPAPYPGPRCATHNREARRARTAGSHETYVGKTYGLYPGEYARIFDTQDGRCAICRRATGVRRRLAVDHDHQVERERGVRASVRGLLCKSCNTILGRFRDDVDTFQRAIDYLNNPPARKILGDEDAPSPVGLPDGPPSGPA